MPCVEVTTLIQRRREPSSMRNFCLEDVCAAPNVEQRGCAEVF
jgi:hypothetical protein